MIPALPEHIQVPADFSVEYREDVYSILDKSFKNKLDQFTKDFLQAQKDMNLPALSPADVSRFPFIDSPLFRHETFTRKQDIRILESLLRAGSVGRGKALEIGGWNGWLSRWLQEAGFEVTSTDIFRDDINGLACRKFHSRPQWLAIQTDLSEPRIFRERFELIVLNHCIQFLPEPDRLIEAYRTLLSAEGMMVVLGVDYRKNELVQQAKVSRYRNTFQRKNGFQVHFYPCRGYVDAGLVNAFKNRDFRFLPYRLSVASALLKKLKGDHCGVYYYSKKTRH